MAGHPGRVKLFRAEPRGTIRLDDRMLACARQAAEGIPRTQLAREYGVSVGCIYGWIERVREATEDAMNRAALARGE